MRILISPAKKMAEKMAEKMDLLEYKELPCFLEKTKLLLEYMQGLTYDEAKAMWKCNDKIACINYDRVQTMDVTRCLTPAILSYEGIQYQYMAPEVLDETALSYMQEHVRILSGFYGMLKPLDGIVPYRLEMQSKLAGFHPNSLYEYWGSFLANELFLETDVIINLASKEYSRCISKYLTEDKSFVTCVFGELVDGKVKEKSTQVKMARGEMVRFMAENQITELERMKEFNRLGFQFNEERSDKDTFVFIKVEEGNHA